MLAYDVLTRVNLGIALIVSFEVNIVLRIRRFCPKNRFSIACQLTIPAAKDKKTDATNPGKADGSGTLRAEFVELEKRTNVFRTNIRMLLSSEALSRVESDVKNHTPKAFDLIEPG